MKMNARLATAFVTATLGIGISTAHAQRPPAEGAAQPNCQWTLASGQLQGGFGGNATSLDECLAQARGHMMQFALNPQVDPRVRALGYAPMAIRFVDTTGRPQQCLLTPVRTDYQAISPRELQRSLVPIGRSPMLAVSPEMSQRLDANIRVDCPTI